MNPWTTKAPDFKNVGIGQVSRLTLDPLGNIRQVKFFLTMTKTSPTADASFNPTLSDALNLFDLGIDDVAGKRQITAQELNEIQSAWAANLSATYYSGKDGNFNTVADTTETDNSVACTVRTGTWVLRMNFAEPSRDSYKARQFFALPTIWKDRDNGNVIKTAKVQFALTVPGPATVTNYVALTAMATGKYNLKNPAYRAEVVYDKGESGPFQGDAILNGEFVRTSQSTKIPACPLVHYYRLNIGYSSTTPVIRAGDMPFIGSVQQASIFSPNGSGDDVTLFQFKKNGDTKLDSSKQSNDLDKIDNAWNLSRLGSSSNDAAGTNWPAADVFHLAFDFDDNPESAEPKAAGDLFEFDLTLAQNTATNKNLVCLFQVYRDALRS